MRLYFEEHLEVNRTKSTLILEGPRWGFLSLSNALMYLLNDLKESVYLRRLTIVSTETGVTLQIAVDASLGLVGTIERTSDREFV